MPWSFASTSCKAVTIAAFAGALCVSGRASAQQYNPYPNVSYNSYAAQQLEMQRRWLLQAELRRQAAVQAEIQRRAAIQAEIQRRAAIQAEIQRRAWVQAELERRAAVQAELARRAARQVDLQRQVVINDQQQAAARLQLTREQSQEYGALWRAAGLVRAEGWGAINGRLSGVMAQLRRHSGMSFAVLPAQTFNWGQAHAGGYIIFDVSSAVQPLPIMAFRLAHEWAHEALGHQPNLYNPFGSSWRIRTSATEDEDAADEYAGEFLCAHGYELAPVKEALSRLPSLTGDSHSGGPARAANVQRGCERVGLGTSSDASE